jgi:hypothetical protein
MSAEYDYRVIYLKSNRPHCYGNVTRAGSPGSTGLPARTLAYGR